MRYLITVLWVYSLLGVALYAHEFAYEKAYREARQEFEKNQGYRFDKTLKAFAGN